MGRTAIVRNWRLQPPQGGLAVIIDVIRFSTTLCALIYQGRKNIFVAENPKSLSTIARLDQFDVFSELSFSSLGQRYDNSPYQALTASPGRPAAICTTTGTRAVFAAKQCQKIIIGGFANFSKVSEIIKQWPGPCWLLPAADLNENPRSIEDDLCAQTFLNQSKHPQESRILQLLDERIADFLEFRPKTGISDLQLCLSLNSLNIVPEIKIKKNSQLAQAF